MRIQWKDTDLKTHEVDLSRAVLVRINGIAISTEKGDPNSITIRTDGPLQITTKHGNCISITDKLKH